MLTLLVFFSLAVDMHGTISRQDLIDFYVSVDKSKISAVDDLLRKYTADELIGMVRGIIIH